MDSEAAGDAERDDQPQDPGGPGRIDAVLVVSSVFGLVLGGLTLAGLHSLYRATWQGYVLSTARVDAWKGPTLLIASAVVILVIHVVLDRVGARRFADWLLIGYALPLVLAAGLVVSEEVLFMLRSRVPQELGIKTSALMPPRSDLA